MALHEPPKHIPRIVCEHCMRDAAVVRSWRDTAQRSTILHVRCHFERLVVLEASDLNPMPSITWGSLRDAYLQEHYMADALLKREERAVDEFDIAATMRSVLASREHSHHLIEHTLDELTDDALELTYERFEAAALHASQRALDARAAIERRKGSPCWTCRHGARLSCPKHGGRVLVLLQEAERRHDERAKIADDGVITATLRWPP